MEWLKLLLENALKERITNKEDLDKTVTGIVTGVTENIGKSYVEKAAHDNTVQELQATKGKMDELQGKVTELTKSSGTSEELQKKLKETEDAFSTFKADTEKREKARQKSSAMEKALIGAGAAADAIDLLLKDIDIEKVNIDSEGKIVDQETIVTGLKEKRKSLFGETSIHTDKPGAKESKPGSKPIEEMTTEEYYASIGMKPFNKATQ
jgi:TolA-binding protein